MERATWLALCLLAGCAAQAPGPLGIPHERPAAAAATEAEYVFTYGDLIEVKFFGHPEFDERVNVRPDGRISLQKVGDLRVVGMTPAGLDSAITAAYIPVLNDPEVTVFLRQFAPRQIYVLGEVRAPGRIALEKDMTLVQALAAAGGPAIGARLGNVVVLRKGAGKSGTGFLADLGAALSGGPSSTITISPDDVVYVPKTAFKSINDFWREAWDGTLRPLDAYIQALAFEVVRQ